METPVHGFRNEEHPLKRMIYRICLNGSVKKRTYTHSSMKEFLNFALPVSAIVTLLLLITGILPYHIFILIFLINLLYITLGLKKINEVHNSLTKKYNFLSSMYGLLMAFEDESFSSTELNKIKLNISGETASAASLSESWAGLSRLLTAEIISSSVLFLTDCFYGIIRVSADWKNGNLNTEHCSLSGLKWSGRLMHI